MTRIELVRAGLFSTIALSLVGLLGGCGYKNPPVSPEVVVPKPVTDLRYTMTGEGVRLSWSYPVETIKGSSIDDISSFSLYKAEVPIDEYCGNCPIPFGEPIEVEAGPTMDGTSRRKATYDVDLLLSGHKYFYKVQSRTSWWAASGDSNIISFVWMDPAAAPAGLEATPGDRQISLRWQPVTKLANGDPVQSQIRYQIYRSAGGKDFVKIGNPIGETSWQDRQVMNGTKYFYRVQSMMEVAGEMAGGNTSEGVAVVPVDLTPPAPVTGVTAVQTGVGIKVFWDRSDSQDLAGYRVYRRSGDSDQYKLVGKLTPEYTLFVDREAEDGVRYYYVVTAIDGASPPNESIKSKEATIRH